MFYEGIRDRIENFVIIISEFRGLLLVYKVFFEERVDVEIKVVCAGCMFLELVGWQLMEKRYDLFYFLWVFFAPYLQDSVFLHLIVFIDLAMPEFFGNSIGIDFPSILFEQFQVS